MSLEDWRRNGWLKAHQTSPNEIRDQVAIADRDLKAARTPGLHNDWSFNIAYNAALQIATAALAASGYQAERMNSSDVIGESDWVSKSSMSTGPLASQPTAAIPSISKTNPNPPLSANRTRTPMQPAEPCPSRPRIDWSKHRNPGQTHRLPGRPNASHRWPEMRWRNPASASA